MLTISPCICFPAFHVWNCRSFQNASSSSTVVLLLLLLLLLISLDLSLDLSLSPMEEQLKELHVFFLPFPAPGHMIPMVDMARQFSEHGVKASIVVTTASAQLIRPSVNRSNAAAASRRSIDLLIVPFPAAEAGLPEGMENLIHFPSPEITKPFWAAMDLLESPVRRLADELRPDFVVSDAFLGWSARLGVPRFLFSGTSCFTTVLCRAAVRVSPPTTTKEQLFEVPGLPHRIETSRSMIPALLFDADAKKRIGTKLPVGMVMNSFYGLEPDYASRLRDTGIKLWLVGPVAGYNKDNLDMAVRGGGGTAAEHRRCLEWLDDNGRRKPGSVLYVSFGSQARLPAAQLTELAAGLEASGHPFVWVLKSGEDDEDRLPEGFEEQSKGLILRGWAPQLLILRHRSVGGFLTHCGWNSTLEGIGAGVPMITWPLFGDQGFNERLIVDVLRVGVAVGVRACSDKAEERSLVGREAVRRVVEELMGGGEEAAGRRARSRKLSEEAAEAVVDRGSSFDDMKHLIDNMVELRKGLK